MSNDYDVVIIGSGPAGLTAAIYCGRAKLNAVVLEKETLGGAIINAELVENFPSYPQGIAGAELSGNMMSQVMQYGINFEFTEVTSIEQAGDLKVVNTTTDSYRTRAVIIASGARYKKLGVPGEEELIGKGVHFCAMCDGGQYSGQEIAVIGGGEGGVTEGLYMTRIASKVTIIEFMPKLNAPAVLQDRARENAQMNILCSTAVEAITETGGLKNLSLKNVETGEKSDLKVGGIFVIIGLEPEVEYLHGLVELDSAGFIKVTSAMETNVPGIFAAGDIRSDSPKQIIAACGDGATAALSAEKFITAQVK